MVETSKVAAANTTNSMKITIPMAIVKKLELEEGDILEWDLDKKGEDWIVIVRKHD